MLLKIDLEQEDIPGGKNMVDVLLLVTNVIIPPLSLAFGVMSLGLPDVAGATLSEGSSDKDGATAVEEESNPMAENTPARSLDTK